KANATLGTNHLQRNVLPYRQGKNSSSTVNTTSSSPRGALPLKLQLHLERLERVVHDRAHRRAIHHRPHTARDRTLASHQVRVALATLRARFVHGTLVAVQKHALAILAPPQDVSLLLAFDHIFRHDALGLDAEVARETIHVALGDLCRRHAATIRALRAI